METPWPWCMYSLSGFESIHRKKWELPEGNSHFLYCFDTIDIARSGHPSDGFDLHFHSFWNENVGVAAVETGGQQHATGMLHLMVRA